MAGLSEAEIDRMFYAKGLQIIHARHVWSGSKTRWLIDKIREDEQFDRALEIARDVTQWQMESL